MSFENNVSLCSSKYLLHLSGEQIFLFFSLLICCLFHFALSCVLRLSRYDFFVDPICLECVFQCFFMFEGKVCFKSFNFAVTYKKLNCLNFWRLLVINSWKVVSEFLQKMKILPMIWLGMNCHVQIEKKEIALTSRCTNYTYVTESEWSVTDFSVTLVPFSDWVWCKQPSRSFLVEL